MTFRANSLTYTQPARRTGMPSPTRPEDLR